MMSIAKSVASWRRLIHALSDPHLNEDMERMADANELDIEPDKASSSMSFALRQLGLLKPIPVESDVRPR